MIIMFFVNSYFSSEISSLSLSDILNETEDVCVEEESFNMEALKTFLIVLSPHQLAKQLTVKDSVSDNLAISDTKVNFYFSRLGLRKTLGLARTIFGSRLTIQFVSSKLNRLKVFLLPKRQSDFAVVSKNLCSLQSNVKRNKSLLF